MTTKQLNLSMEEKTAKHPCYSYEAHHKYARLHLPVAPKCNISCNYCNRKFDCVNESRPGVTSEILTPEKALERFCLVRERLGNLSVVGIAGPGDALANWSETQKTLKLIREEDENITFCLSTNGLVLPDHVDEMREFGIDHVTVTVNCIDPRIGALIYKNVSYQGKTYSGSAGAKILIDNQLQGIKLLTEKGVLVKINTVMMEGINDDHIPEIIHEMKELGAFTSNIMPLIPVQGSVFEDHPPTSMQRITETRKKCGENMRQMTHCKQCRADAIGMLGKDCSEEFIEGRKKCSCKREAG
ncbi:Radical SAM domain protein [Syntrophobotulus glycolicus DSM 8271]|uniref:FeMo cofactor biosynthesis protein NifB n=1 Tax=Syntrophobotulus glycolicus (strain DSM 8271 / FlGlyR) TaxID=645991 RepID=F0SYJ2_SYNGF|nr:nitrogenase cofactor biosynthesis protein NifB [Syntrophobotulus glycolicus]ADY57104.1 Radical SAM domain protein [Syntrophobotulus glycolicus DSM 8271]